MTARRSELRRALDRSLATLHVDPDRLHAALMDVPYGVVRRYLVARQSIPSGVDRIVEDCVRALVT